MKLSLKTANHLFWRAGFGVDYSTLKKWHSRDHTQLVRSLLEESSTYSPLHTDWISPSREEYQMASEKEKSEMRSKSRKSLRQLNVDWIGQMVTGNEMLREKMALFWHNHFACRPNNPNMGITYVNTLRRNAIGNFGTLLHEISKEPAMIAYLNNRQNRKDSPNENFAREVMELFTLGRDKIYTEADIKEAARAFTGWSMNLRGEFIKRPGQHDFGYKTFLNKTGKFDGEEILDIILEQKQTAVHIVSKLYRFLVNDKPDNKRIEFLSEKFYRSGYDIAAILEEIFLSGWFYDQENMGNLIKSPIEYVVGAQKQFHMKLTDTKSLIFIQTALGQQLLAPPNVAGWPGGLNWIDSGTLLARMNLTQIMLASGAPDTSISASGDDNDPLKINRRLKKLETSVDWNLLKEEWKDMVETAGFEGISGFLLLPENTISHQPKNKNEFLPMLLHLTKLPEYQMC